jgi:hypothetical protein
MRAEWMMKSFEAGRTANRLYRDGDAKVLKPVPGLEVPSGEPEDLETMRRELNEQLQQEGSTPAIMTKLVNKEQEGWFVVCPMSFNRLEDTFEVRKASDLKQSLRVNWKDTHLEK